MSVEEEERAYTRKSIRARAEIRLKSGVLVEGETRDISMNGVLFLTGSSLPVGHNVRLTLVLDDDEGKVRIISHGQVARVADEGVGIVLEEVRSDCRDRFRDLVVHQADEVCTGQGPYPQYQPSSYFSFSL